MNTFYHGDCLFVMNHDIEPNSVDLIYLDPPFFTGKVQRGIAKWQPGAMEVSYDDSKRFWKEKGLASHAPEWLKHIALKRPDFAAYLYYMMERLEACYKVLNDKGSIYLHCDEKASHYLKMIMDEVFGYDTYRNEIIWVKGREGSGGRNLPTEYQNILLYKKDRNYTWHPPKQGYKLSTVNNIKQDENGWYYGRGRGVDPRGSLKTYVWQDPNTPKNLVIEEITKLHYEGSLIGDIWHIPQTPTKERVGYPTQKPLALLERVINASSNKDDTVLDPFCGCGTAIIAAQKLGRNWIGIDISRDAYQVSKDRYHQLTLDSTFGQPEPEYIERTLGDVLAIEKPTDFEKWVNHYFKAKKPNPDKGIDGITPGNIPIQTKTFKVNDSWVRKLVGDAKFHPQVKQPFDHAILVSQQGFDDSARQMQFTIQTKEGIKVELLTPSMMLEGDGIL